MKWILNKKKWLVIAGVIFVIFNYAEFCSDCEPMNEPEECTIHPVYNCHQSKYQHWTDMNKRRDE